MQEKKQSNDVPFRYIVNLFLLLYFLSEGICDKIFNPLFWILSTPFSFLLFDDLIK